MNRTITSVVVVAVGLVLAAVIDPGGLFVGDGLERTERRPAPLRPRPLRPPRPSTAAGGGATGDAVSIKDFSFDPAELTVKVGAKVTWTNQGDASHTVTFDTGGVDQ